MAMDSDTPLFRKMSSIYITIVMPVVVTAIGNAVNVSR
jgi:hypothetical protein